MGKNDKSVLHLMVSDDGFEDFVFDSDFDVSYDERDKIENVDSFKRELERANLMSDALAEFIENYMRFDNN